VRTAGDEPRQVRDVEHHVRTDLVGDLLERLGLDTSRIARRTRNDHARSMLVREATHFFEVDSLVVDAHLVRAEVVEDSARVDRRAVREVSAVVEAQPQHHVARFQHRLVHRHVCAGAGVRLHVGVLGAEEPLHALDRDRLDLVDDGVAAVVALAGVALAVLVGEEGARRGHHGGRREVLARDELQARRLAHALALDERGHLRVGRGLGRPGHGGQAIRVGWCTAVSLPPRARGRRVVPRGARDARPRRACG